MTVAVGSMCTYALVLVLLEKAEEEKRGISYGFLVALRA